MMESIMEMLFLLGTAIRKSGREAEMDNFMTTAMGLIGQRVCLRKFFLSVRLRGKDIHQKKLLM